MASDAAGNEGAALLRVFQVTRILLLTLFCFSVLRLPLARALQESRPLAKDDVLNLLVNDVDPSRVADIAHQRGVAFGMTSSAEKQLRDAGADDHLIKVLRDLGPKPKEEPPPSSSPPILLVQAAPGGAQVYIDDEPLGTTSPEGRLKLSRLAAGEHKVRLALTGYQDYEQSVTLTSGQTAMVSTTLAARQAAQTQPAGGAATQPGTPSGDTATLGVLISKNPPPGTSGAYISDIAPGGPADKAGLRPGYSILSVEGKSISTPDQLPQIMSTLRPGMVADVTYTDGSAQHTVGVHLVARSSMPQASASQVASSLLNPANPPQTVKPAARVLTFAVAHDHGSSGQDYCMGTLAVGNGMIQYRSTNGVHSFDFPASAIKEAKKNGVYLVALGAFHIRLKKGTNFNFVQFNSAGKFQPADALLAAIEQEMAKGQ